MTYLICATCDKFSQSLLKSFSQHRPKGLAYVCELNACNEMFASNHGCERGRNISYRREPFIRNLENVLDICEISAE